MRRRAKFEIISLITLGMMGAGGASVGALSYQSNVGVGFTFNPTLTVSLSSADLTIPGLTLDSTGVSNDITVSVSTNAAYGYTLSATVGNNSTYNSDNLINSSDSSKVFSNIATDANLANLGGTSDTNIWGYSYKDNTVTTPAWSNYNGLPLYSATGTTLIDTNSAATDGSADFRIAAKTSSTQASGEYNNVINFVAVSKVGVVSLLDALVASNATQQNGYYTMQGMTPAICSASAVGSSAQLLDVRDNKLYWVAKLADGNCWMTQNLDLAGGMKLSSDTTDFTSAYALPTTDGWTVDNGELVLPISAVKNAGDNNLTDGTQFSTSNYAYVFNSGDTTNCGASGQNAPCYSYYSWDAATLGSGRGISADNTDAQYSICPKGWKLPTSRTTDVSNWQIESDFYTLAHQYGLDSTTSTSEFDGDFYNQAGPGTTPNFLSAGYYNAGSFFAGGNDGYYWSSTAGGDVQHARHLLFYSSYVFSAILNVRNFGMSVRCFVAS